MNKLDMMYILPNTPEPRNENIINLVKGMYKTGVIFWKKHPEQTSYKLDGCDVFEISVKANDHNPFLRIIPMLSYYKKGLDVLNQTNPKCIHVSKVDSLYMVWLYWKQAKVKPHIIYDISDLHTLAYNDSTNLIKVLIRKLLWKIEYKMRTCVDYILITSPKFYDEYYKDFYEKEQVVFVPNAPDVSCFDGFVKKSKGPFTIGFIGSVRYYNQMVNLIDASVQAGVDVFIAGSGADESRLRDYAKDMPTVHFHGKYDYTKEISGLYEKIDCVYALYDTSIKNVKVALPNKLYEGAYCGLPFIASKGVYVAEIIENYGLGIAAEDGNYTDLMVAINKVKSISKNQIEDGCKKFSEENSFAELSKKIKEVYKELCV